MRDKGHTTTHRKDRQLHYKIMIRMDYRAPTDHVFSCGLSRASVVRNPERS